MDTSDHNLHDGGENKEQLETQTNIDYSCSICRDEISFEDKASLVSCGHTFHRSCIDHWFEHRNTCPECRAVTEQVHFNFRGQGTEGPEFESRDVPEPEEPPNVELRLAMISVGDGVFAYNLFPIPIVEVISVFRDVNLIHINGENREVVQLIHRNEAYRLTHEQLLQISDYRIENNGVDHALVQPLIQLFTSQLTAVGMGNPALEGLEGGGNEQEGMEADDDNGDSSSEGPDNESEEGGNSDDGSDTSSIVVEVDEMREILEGQSENEFLTPLNSPATSPPRDDNQTSDTESIGSPARKRRRSRSRSRSSSRIRRSRQMIQRRRDAASSGRPSPSPPRISQEEPGPREGTRSIAIQTDDDMDLPPIVVQGPGNQPFIFVLAGEEEENDDSSAEGDEEVEIEKK